MSSGGKLQLAFRGPQDAYVSGSPQMTFFKSMYKRYTNFAKESVWIGFDGNPRAGGKSTAIIERQGDLVQEAFITVTLTVTAGNLDTGGGAEIIAYAAERLVDSVELYIGQQLIDKHYQRWWRLYSELYQDNAKKATYTKMITPDSAGEVNVYLPLLFFFNRNPGLALPLVSMANQQVRIVCNWSNANVNGVWDSIGVVDFKPETIKFWASYIYLDEEERTMMSTRNQSYLIEQLQYSGTENIPATAALSTKAAAGTTIIGSAHRVPLNFKHPVKELVWCFPQKTGSHAPDDKLYNFTTDVTAGSVLSLVPTTADAQPHLSGGLPRLAGVIGESAVGPLVTMEMELNKSKIVEQQESKYFNSMQPFDYHSGCPMPGVYSYSFALDPESSNPTGSCNFSRIEDAACFVRIERNARINNNDMEMFATNFNVLDIKKGFASLAFSS